MKQRNGLRCFNLLLACMASAAGAAETPAYSFESAQATSMPVLAESLLGRERAADVVSAQPFVAGLINTGLFSVEFLHRPVPEGADFCLQKRNYVSFAGKARFDPADQEHPERWMKSAGTIGESNLIALAPGCHLLPGQLMMHMNSPVTLEAGMAALKDLAAVQLAARADAPLPFRLTCQDDMNRDRRLGSPDCTATARATLASLPAERAGIMNSGMIILFLENKDEWIVSTSGLGTGNAAVALTRRGIIIRH